MSIEVIYKYKCSLCNEFYTDSSDVWINGVLPAFCLPYGWHRVDEKIVCSNHDVNVEDKGKK